MATITYISEKRVPGNGYFITFDILLGGAETTFSLADTAAEMIKVPISADWVVYETGGDRGEVYWDATNGLFKGQDFSVSNTIRVTIQGEFAT